MGGAVAFVPLLVVAIIFTSFHTAAAWLIVLVVASWIFFSYRKDEYDFSMKGYRRDARKYETYMEKPNRSGRSRNDVVGGDALSEYSHNSDRTGHLFDDTPTQP